MSGTSVRDLAMPDSLRRLLGSAVVIVLAAGTTAARAGDATWNTNAAGNWVDGPNWSPAAAPGVSDGGATITSPDTATFGTVISAARIVTVDADRNISGINFAGNSSAYTLSGGSLRLSNGGLIQTSGAGSGHTDIISTPITLEGDGGSLTFTAGSSSSTRVLSLTGNIAGVARAGNTTTLTLNGANTAGNSIGTGVVGDGGGGKVAIAKSDIGTWTLAGANTFSGGVTLNDGTLRLGHATCLGTGTLTIHGGVLNNNTGANLTLTSNNPQIWNGDFTLRIGTGSGSYSLGMGSGDVTLTGNRIVTVSSSGTQYGASVAGIIADSGMGYSLTKSGPGRLTLTANNTFSGGFILNSGAVSLGANGVTTTAPGTGTITINGGSLVASGATLGGNNAQIWAGDFSVLSGNGFLVMGTGSVTLTGDRQVSIAVSQTLGVGGAIADGGSGYGLTITGTGTMSLSGASTYGGATTVSSGTLQIGGADDRLPTGTVLTVNGGASAGGTFNLGGRNQTVAGLAGGSGVVPGYVHNSVTATTRTLTVTGTSTFDGVLRNNGGTGGTLALTKSTGGVLTLTGANTYSGATTISGGALLVNGSLSASSAVAVNSGGTLGGSGSVGAVTVDAGGNLAPGSSAGILSTGNLLLSASANFAVELNGNTAGTGYDQANVTGTVSLDGANLAATLGYAAVRGELLFIVNNDGGDAITGTFTGLADGAMLILPFNGIPYRFVISYFGDAATQSLTGGNDVVLKNTWDGGTGSILYIR